MTAQVAACGCKAGLRASKQGAFRKAPDACCPGGNTRFGIALYHDRQRPNGRDGDRAFINSVRPPKLTLGNYRVKCTTRDFSIPPGDSDAETFAILPVPRRSVLYSMAPHMHLRRASGCVTSCSIPAGSGRRCFRCPTTISTGKPAIGIPRRKRSRREAGSSPDGGFDNSPQNPNNPAPGKRIGWGDQSFNDVHRIYGGGKCRHAAEYPKPNRRK